jgi:hypothetical protein
MTAKLLVAVAGFFAIAIASAFGWLCLNGYIYAVPYSEYASDGVLSQKGFHYFNPNFGWVRHGHWIKFGENGNIFCEGDFDRGREVGLWTWRNPDGSPSETTEHREDGTCKITKYTNGVGTVVSDTAVTPVTPNSGRHWDDDRAKNAVIEAEFVAKCKSGMNESDAIHAIDRELRLKRSKAAKDSASRP